MRICCSGNISTGLIGTIEPINFQRFLLSRHKFWDMCLPWPLSQRKWISMVNTLSLIAAVMPLAWVSCTHYDYFEKSVIQGYRQLCLVFKNSNGATVLCEKFSTRGWILSALPFATKKRTNCQYDKKIKCWEIPQNFW